MALASIEMSLKLMYIILIYHQKDVDSNLITNKMIRKSKSVQEANGRTDEQKSVH